MKVFAISLVRDEVDVIRTNVLHSFSLGIDGRFIVDNGSTDGTTRELERLGRDPRLRWTRDESPFLEKEMLNALAHEARRAGADWIIQIDADEFWTAGRHGLKKVLQNAKAPKLRAGLVNFVQRREQLDASPAGLLQMTRRPATLVRPPAIKDLVSAGKLAFVEVKSLGRVITRTSHDMVVERGGHQVHGVPGEEASTDAIVMLHAPLRARSALDAKADKGQRVEEAGFSGDEAWHLRRWRQMRDDGLLDAEWAANSYANDCLDVYGRTTPLVRDLRLHDAVKPWL